MTVKAQKPIVIFRGDNTAAFDLRTIKILLAGDLDLSRATAKFTLLDFSKTWTEQEVATGELSIAFTAEQTKAFALGPQTGTLRLYDMSTGTPRQLTIVNKIPFFVTNRVCEIDSQSYEADVCVSGGDVIHIEFKVGAGAVEGKADKVKNATSGDLASLTADGNLEDSGIPKTDVLRKSQMDATPTAGSQNPVTSDGIKQAIDAATPSDYEQVKAQVSQNADDIDTIEGKIPAQASAQNQLADKAFVNSSIATNTATFRGSYNLVSDLGLTVSATEQQVAAAIAAKLASLVPPVVPENNDYCFVQVPRNTQDPADFDPTVIERVDRYKCTVTESGGVTTRMWEYEWSLNNSSFTAEQWAAINSGITSGLVEKLNGIEAGAQVNTVTSVNSRTGAVTLSASDVGALGNSGNQTLDGTLTATSFRSEPGNGPFATFGITDIGEAYIGVDPTGGAGEARIKIRYDSSNVGEVMAFLSEIYAAVQQIAPDFTAKAYALNELCTYNGVVYRCKSAYTATASSEKPNSDTTHWEAKKVSELFLGNTGDQTLNGTLTLGHTRIEEHKIVYDVGAAGESNLMFPPGKNDYLALLSDIYAAVQQIAPAWVSGTTYTQNALVSYNGVVYCNTMGGTFVSTIPPNSDTNWARKKVSELFLPLTGGTMTGPLTMDRSVIELKDSTGYKRVLRCTGTGGDFYIDCYNAQGTLVLSTLIPQINGSLAPLASPAFTGTPTAPTPTAGDNSTKVATTAFVQGALPYAIATVDDDGGYFVVSDRCVNRFDVTSFAGATIYIVPPDQTAGKSRDFYVAVTCGATVPSVEVVGAFITYTLINAKGESADLTLTANTTTVLHFTEVANGSTGVNPVFVVTGGANGGGSVDPAQLAGKLDSEAAAPDYDSTATYAEGEYVTYQGKLYYAKQAITTAEAWTAAHWQETDMTSPDATLDITSQGSLRVVSAGGQTLWQQGYKLASASSATLSNEGVNIFTFAAVAAFDDTASYAIGDTVAYDGKAYTFTSAHSAGAWTGSDVELAAQSFSLPAAPTGKVGDFILEIDNTANASVDVAIDIAEYTNTTISLVIPDGAAIDDMTTIGGGMRCEFYFTQTAFNVNSKPTWKVVRQDVEASA